MNLPNFLVVGAQKSGTSSLYHYLLQHPQIFLPKIKEPLYFIKEVVANFNLNDIAIKNEDLVYKLPKTIDQYKALFKDVKKQHSLVGECSASYLYYFKYSIPNIKKTLGDPKIIILLRHPVDKAFSQYKHLKRLGAEKRSFEDALRLEKERIQNNYSALYHYTNQGLYYNQIKAFLNNFSNVKIILTSELKIKPNDVIDDIFLFLGLKKYFSIDVSKEYNVTNYIPKSFFIHQIIKKNRFVLKLKENSLIKLLIPAIKDRYFKMNSSKIPVLDKNTKKYLVGFFENEILNIEKLINKDLKKWESKN